MELNWDPGNSLILGVLRGAENRAVKRTMTQNEGSIVSPKGIACHVVQVCKHVGSQITSACNDTADVQYRLVKAKQAFGALAKRCFATASSTVERKWMFFVAASRVSCCAGPVCATSTLSSWPLCDHS